MNTLHYNNTIILLILSLSLSLSLSLFLLSFQESSLDWDEVEEALAVVREKKEKGEPVKSLPFLETLEDNKGSSMIYTYIH